MDIGLRDRVYLVTGGSAGLGLATAQALVSEGARVVLSARDPVRLASAARELGPGNALAVPADNADETAPARLIAAARDSFGRIDGALISVGGPPPGAATQVTDDAWRAAFETVFLGAVRLAVAVSAALSAGGGNGGRPPDQHGGSIAFVLSSSVRTPIGSLAISNGLRPGLAGLAKTLAEELGPVGIRVNGLLPGRIDTDRVRELDATRGDPVTIRAEREQEIPLRRYGTQQEFGRVAAFVLSPAASYLTGAMIPVDGGLLRVI